MTSWQKHAGDEIVLSQNHEHDYILGGGKGGTRTTGEKKSTADMQT